MKMRSYQANIRLWHFTIISLNNFPFSDCLAIIFYSLNKLVSSILSLFCGYYYIISSIDFIIMKGKWCKHCLISDFSFQYDKEITVINTAVACSRNSRNGIFDLPIAPGEELDVIDVTEENLVICRNSKGKCKLLAYCPQNVTV